MLFMIIRGERIISFSEDVLGEGETKAATEISIATGQPAGRLGHQVY